MKKNVFIGLTATLVILAGLGVSKTFAASSDNNNGYGMMGMMRNFDSDDFQKMNDMHKAMSNGNYDEARNIIKELGMGNGMMGGNGGGMMGNWNNNGNSGNNGNYGGMMGGNGRGMMGNF